MLNNLKLARLKAGFSQKDLAAKIGVTSGAVSQWEKGLCKPSCKNLALVAETLNVPITDLLEKQVI